MTTFKDDFVRLIHVDGVMDITLKDLGMSWPPPEVLDLELNGCDYLFDRIRMSPQSDDERKNSNTPRGAMYEQVTVQH